MPYISPRYTKRIGLNYLQSEHFKYDTERLVIISRTTAASVVYLVSGNVILSSDHVSFKAKAGDALWVPNGILYRAEWKGSPTLEFYSFHFSDVNDIFYPLQKITSLSCAEVLNRATLIHHLISEESGKEDIWTAAGAFCGLIAEAMPELSSSERPHYPDALSAALGYCEDHFLERFSNETLAQHCHISEPRLYSLFHSYLNTTPVSYVNSLRIAEASRLLSENRLTVEQISDSCGFGGSNYFRKVFHEAAGMSPTDYRRAVRSTEPIK